MRNKVVLIFLIGIISLITIFLFFSKNIKNQISSEEYFAYLGNPQSINSLNILNSKQVAFYVARGTHQGKTATFFINADQIDKAIQDNERIIGGNNLVVELLPEWVQNAQYKLRFRSGLVPLLIFSECKGKTEDCYFEDIRNLVRRALTETEPQSIPSSQITINEESYEIIEAEPKKTPTGRGCHPTSYQLIKYNGNWYTFKTSELCVD